MTDFKSILEIEDPNKLSYRVEVNGDPVWDYKREEYKVVLIHSRDIPKKELKEEQIILSELKDFIIESEIPFKRIKFFSEESFEELKDIEIKDTILNFK